MLHLSAFAAAHLRTAAAAAQRHSAVQNVALLVASERQASELAAAPGGWPGPLVRAFEVRSPYWPNPDPGVLAYTWRTAGRLAYGTVVARQLERGVCNPQPSGTCFGECGTEPHIAHFVQGNDTVAPDLKRLTAAAMAQYAAFSLSLQLPESVFQARPISAVQRMHVLAVWRTQSLDHVKVVFVPAFGGGSVMCH